MKKQSVPWIHCIDYTFLVKNIFGIYFYIYTEYTTENFWATCALALKNSMPRIHGIDCTFLSFRIFKQLALALKNRVCPEIFHFLKYFLSFRIFEQLALALKFLKSGGMPLPSTASYAYVCGDSCMGTYIPLVLGRHTILNYCNTIAQYRYPATLCETPVQKIRSICRKRYKNNLSKVCYRLVDIEFTIVFAIFTVSDNDWENSSIFCIEGAFTFLGQFFLTVFSNDDVFCPQTRGP